jgi:hypothetical protein
MLVYHFKGRITIVEQKCDTMFEIMNNMVKEMRMIKMQLHNRVNHEMMLPNNETIMSNLAQFTQHNHHLDVIDEHSDECEDEDEDEDEDYEDEDEDEDEEYENNQKIVVSDNDSDDDNHSVKIITIDFENDNDTPSVEIDNLEEVIEEISEEEIIEDNDELDNFDVVSEPITITVNKLEQSNQDNESLVKSETVDYKKLDISYLRTMVITRGLSTDTKKMKKNDLVKLLEQNE